MQKSIFFKIIQTQFENNYRKHSKNPNNSDEGYLDAPLSVVKHLPHQCYKRDSTFKALFWQNIKKIVNFLKTCLPCAFLSYFLVIIILLYSYFKFHSLLLQHASMPHFYLAFNFILSFPLVTYRSYSTFSTCAYLV